MSLIQVTGQIRDLQTRINSLSDRLTSGIESHHHVPDPLIDQLSSVARRVDELMSGRERLSLVSQRLAVIEPLLLVTDIGSRDPKVTQELLLLEEDVIREESLLYDEIKRMEPVLSRNHLVNGVAAVTDRSNGADGIAAITSRAEEQAGESRRVREETDQLMQFHADLVLCIDSLLAEWDKKIRRIEKK